MPRNRMIQAEFWDDEKLSKISMQARLLFIGLWTFSDDYGVVKGDPRWLKSRIFPYDDSLQLSQFKKWLSEIENIFVFRFSQNGETYYFIKNFEKHQSISRPSQKRNPEPPDTLNECSVSTQETLNDEIEIEKEIKKKKKYKSAKICFEKFYHEYPLKKSKDAAFKAWQKRNGDLPPIDEILQAIQNQKTEREILKANKQFVPEWKYPATWINQGCWNDECTIKDSWEDL